MNYRRKILYIAVYSALAAVCFSCMSGRKYQRPDLRLPEHLAADTLAWEDPGWMQVYSDTLLQNLITSALADNKDMLIAAARITELGHLKRISNAALLPSTGMKVYADRELEDYGGDNFSRSDGFEGKLTVSWEIDLWGNLRWARQKDIAQYLQSVEAQRALQMSLVAGVAQAYFELVALDNELEIVEQTLSTREEGVRQAQLRFEGGLTSETSYQQAQVELASTAALIPELKRLIRAKENEISLLCGRYPGAVERTDRRLDIPDRLPGGLPSELLLRRPDVLGAEQALMAANASVGIAHTDRFPRLSLTATYGRESDVLSEFLKSPYTLLAGNLAGPLFSFNAKRAKYRAAQAAYEQACRQYEKKVLEVFMEASDAITGFNTIREERELQQNLERAAYEYVRLARLQYINGVINYLDVLDAQRKYFDAQIALSNAVRDERIALVKLYKTMGGGWTTMENRE